jgi:hypothetical protein
MNAPHFRVWLRGEKAGDVVDRLAFPESHAAGFALIAYASRPARDGRPIGFLYNPWKFLQLPPITLVSGTNPGVSRSIQHPRSFTYRMRLGSHSEMMGNAIRIASRTTSATMNGSTP